MYKLCKTEQSANRQRELEQGLLEVMATCHYEEITISDLCEKMGIPRKSFYRYFSGKDGALHALIDHTMLRYEEIGSFEQFQLGSAGENELVRFFTFWKKQKPLLDALERSGLSGIMIERIMNLSLSEAGLRNIYDSSRMGEGEYTVLFAVCGLMAMVFQWHHGGYQQPEERMAEMAYRVMSRPLNVPHRK